MSCAEAAKALVQQPDKMTAKKDSNNIGRTRPFSILITPNLLTVYGMRRLNLFSLFADETFFLCRNNYDHTLEALDFTLNCICQNKKALEIEDSGTEEEDRRALFPLPEREEQELRQ